MVWVGCEDGGKNFRKVLRSAARDAGQPSRHEAKAKKADKDKGSELAADEPGDDKSPVKQVREDVAEATGITSCPKGARLNGAPPPKGISQWCSAATKDGKDIRHGEYRRWYSNGKPKIFCGFKNGKFDGPYKEWFSSGDPKEEAMYTDNVKNGPWIMYNKDGTKKVDGVFADGKKNGRFVYYSRKGGTEREGGYADDVEHGVWITYHRTGNIKTRITYAAGKKSGRAEYFSKGGILLAQESYREDIPDGPWTEFWNNGNRKTSGAYLKGQKHGQWTDYKRDGAVRLATIYNNGSLVGTQAGGNTQEARTSGAHSKRARLKGQSRFKNGDILGVEHPESESTGSTQAYPILEPEDRNEKIEPVDQGRGWQKM